MFLLNMRIFIEQFLMRKITVVTTFPPHAYETYAKRMLENFEQNWPKDIQLLCYYEQNQPDVLSDRIEYRDLEALAPQLVDFKTRHKDNPHANGQSPYKDKKSYLWDAVRFAHKTFCVDHAGRNCGDTDILIWCDADTITFKPITQNFLETLLPEDAYCSYLGRTQMYPECGWVMYNVKSEWHNKFLQTWTDFYTTDSIFKELEFHDSYIWEQTRKRLAEQGMNHHNITPNHPHRPGVHVFINGPLGEYIDHLKGPRKKLGSSKKSDIYNPKSDAYWSKLNA